MTWSNFIYMFQHAARDAGAAAITGNNAFHADFPKDFLIDDRAGSLCKFNGSASDHWIQIDRGSGSLGNFSRMIIPSGHNLDGTTLTVKTGASSPPGTTRFTGAVAAGIIYEAVTINSDRYVRLEVTGTGTWEIPQLIYTTARTTTRGPEPGWGDYFQHNTLDFQKESGAIASLSLGADRRLFELDYRDVNLAADLLVFSELLTTCGTSKPFHIFPAFDTSTPLWVKLTDDSRQTQDESVPAATDSPMKHIRLSMLEHLA
jgi:hypothetical protein